LADDRWRALLPLLRAKEELAWGQIINWYFGDVFAGLLHQVRRLNSNHGGALPEPDVIEAGRELTFEGFRAGMEDIDSFQPERADLPTWIYWKGMARSKGLLGDRLRQERERMEQESLDSEPAAANPRLEPRALAVDRTTPETILVSKEGQTELRGRLDRVFGQMRQNHVEAIVEVWRLREDGTHNPVAEAARRSGRSVEAMESLLRRARQEFRRIWAQEFGETSLSAMQ
jgi:DNA-directed RNA polymerase specialized sigma24 family protein